MKGPRKSTIVYRTIRREREFCEYGDAHMVDVVVTRTLWSTDRVVTREYGIYQVEQCSIWEDIDRKEYEERVPGDYAGQLSYWCPQTEMRWESRQPSLARLVTGVPLTPGLPLVATTRD